MAKGTVYVPDELWIPFRQQCLARRTSASTIVTQLVRDQIRRWEQEEQPTRTQASTADQHS